MLKKFIKDNRGQVLYAVLVTVMFVGMISMLTMGLTLRNYNVALQKQQRVADYYAADAVAEQIRIGVIQLDEELSEFQKVNDDIWVQISGNQYVIIAGTVTITMELELCAVGDNISETADGDPATEPIAPQYEFSRWEVSYHEKSPVE